MTTRAVERWKEEMPTEEEMLPRDKYTIFDRKEKKYRKGIHSEYFRTSISPRRTLKVMQNYPSGREYRNESIHLVTELLGLGNGGLAAMYNTAL
jgi:hypothetical protein